MASFFKLQNVEEQLKPDTFYRLDFVRGIDLTGNIETDLPFKTVLVNFCEYSEEYQDLDKIKSIKHIDRFKNKIGDISVISKTATLPEDITNQVFLQPGTVWCNGRFVWKPSECSFVAINQENRSITNFKTESKDHSILFPYIEKSNFSNLLKFPDSTINGQNVTVLIPVMEVIRYYYSGSRYFTSKLFNGGFEGGLDGDNVNSTFLYKKSFDDVTKNVYLWMRRKCYDSDAIHLARAIADKKACSAMTYIYSSMVSIQGFYHSKAWDLYECCPKTNLPFDDSTDLEVIGSWMPPNEHGEFTTYLVRSIDSCSHPLPYKSIDLESVDSYRSKRNSKENLKPVLGKEILSDEREDKKPVLTEGKRPNEGIEPQELDFCMERLQQLSNVNITKIHKASEKEKESYLLLEEIESESEKGSTKKGNHEQDNDLEPWEIRLRESHTIPVSERLEMISKIIKTIYEQSSQIEVSALPIDHVDDTKPFGLYEFERPFYKKQNYTWTEIGDRKRKALFLELDVYGHKVYALDIESKNGAGYSFYILSDPLTNSDCFNAKTFLQMIANRSGNGIISNVFSSYFGSCISIKHTTTNDDSLHERLERGLYSGFSSGERSE